MRILGETERIREAVTERMDTKRALRGSASAAGSAPKSPSCLLRWRSRNFLRKGFRGTARGRRCCSCCSSSLAGRCIIDQPERRSWITASIAELTDKLHDAKQNRQLIFASHNANIVVNGSDRARWPFGPERKWRSRVHGAQARSSKPELCRVITSTIGGRRKSFQAIDRTNMATSLQAMRTSVACDPSV